MFELLRARRLELAKSQGVPPYVVFHDATLVEIVRDRPDTLAALGRITGIGAAKLERYGDEVIRIVTEHGAGGGGEEQS